MTSVPSGRIIGWGTALPDDVLTNADLEARLDTTDEWITERTGIQERRQGGTTAGLAAEAGQAAIDHAGVDPASIDLLILCTTSPDRSLPASASRVQQMLGLDCGAFDLNAACSGFVYGLAAANGYIAMGSKRVLLIGAETLDRMTDPDDRNTAILFGNGGGAAVIDAIPEGEPTQLLGWDVGSDGSLEHILYSEVGGYMQMDGREVFRRAVRVMVASANKAMERAGVTAEDIALVVPHQANIRIIDSACQKLGFAREQTALVLHATGNTSAASIPLALADALDNGRAQDGDLVLLVGFGAGMTWASAVLRWSDPAMRKDAAS
ncbi:beta-ketoacyl-ACP synthase III [Actinospongicola halichondriae]|uniref:beta-ketoacyl-ACP synthase III n=1 Tax=Actinospongicola halichondriae TaxID=3236844 RepID=UPI003D374E02